tara:strand:+ start:87358 stop:88200 length:843 start_codon:yes stop_codon:yes gene_type:complete
MLTFKTSKAVLTFLKLKPKHIGLVPTMGALHSGHISLVKKACKENDYVVVSVYLNPTQFNNASDLENYPIDLDRDKKLLKPFSDQIIFYTPEHKEIYPKKIQRNSYDFGTISTHMEGFFRPGHFDGVATVVEALFKNIKPQKAYFGEKDFQQLQIIKVLNIQKKLNVNVIGCPIVREKDGLAMSSRNKFLTPNERKAAPIIYSTLRDLNRKNIKTDVPQMRRFFKEKVEQHILKVEYFFVAPVCNLIPVSKLDSNIKYRFFVAVLAGKTRLIDTVELVRI